MELSKELGLMLYWGEGDKAQTHMVALTNTDPKLLAYFAKWLREYFKIDEERLRCRLYLWENLEEQKIKEYWSKTLNIPTTQFTKSYISKSKPNIRKNRHNKGVCRVSYCSTVMLKEIKNSIEQKFH